MIKLKLITKDYYQIDKNKLRLFPAYKVYSLKKY